MNKPPGLAVLYVGDLSDSIRKLGITEHEGYRGSFTTAQAEGAIPNGSKVIKVLSKHGDAHADGELATVLGSLMHPSNQGVLLYFVEWDTSPKYAVGIIGDKIKAVN